MSKKTNRLSDEDILERADKLHIEFWRLRSGELIVQYQLEGSGTIESDGKVTEGKTDLTFLHKLMDRFTQEGGHTSHAT